MAAEDYETIFEKGVTIEVSSEDHGLRGSWYTATVLRKLSRKSNKILVEYHSLMADEKGSKPLREFVDWLLVRPIPPRELNRKFKVSEEVDAYHNDGWWEGVVIEVLDGSRYSVFFRCSREQIEFHENELRLHREWVHGDWVPPLVEEKQQQKARCSTIACQKDNGLEMRSIIKESKRKRCKNGQQNGTDQQNKRTSRTVTGLVGCINNITRFDVGPPTIWRYYRK